MKKRLAALVLSMALVIQLLPVSALAEGEAPGELGNEAVAAEAGQPQATVIGELADRRGESEKHFRMSDGSFVAVDYGAPVHFTEDEGETWNDIDNTLALSRGDTELYVAENGDSVRGFASDLRTGRLFTVANGDYSLRMGLASDADDAAHETRNASASAEISYPDVKTRGNEELSFAEQITPAKLRAEVLYRDVYEDVDLLYELYSYNVKETILVNAPRDSYAFSFSLDLDGLTPALLEDGSVELRDGDGEAVYLIPAPYLYDADGAESAAVAYTLEETASGAWTLTVTADASWMNDENRAFPVAIDPTVIQIPTTSIYRIITSYVNSGRTDIASYNNTRYLRSGFYTNPDYDSNCTGYTVGLIYIRDLPKVPDNCMITDARLGFFQVLYGGIGNNDYHKLYATTGINPANPISYLGSMTWNSYLANIVGSYYPLGDTNEPLAQDYQEESLHIHVETQYVITNVAKKWYDGSDSTYSRLLVLDDGHSNTDNARVTYGGYLDENGYAPRLYVTYRNQVGIEGIYGYHTQNIGCAGVCYINDQTLKPSVTVPILSAPSSALPFAINLTYNEAISYSQFTSDAASLYTDNTNIHTKDYDNAKTGMGWKTSLQQTVKYAYYYLGGDSIPFLVYTDADGTEHYFNCQNYGNGNTVFKDEDGLNLTIVTYDNIVFTMTDKEKNTWTFTHGYLTEFADNNGNHLYYAYKGYNYSSNSNSWKPNSNSDGKGGVTGVWRKNDGGTLQKIATMTYTNGFLQSITDAANRTTELHYDQYNCLERITFPDGKEALYEYYDYLWANPNNSNDTRTYYRISQATDDEAKYRVEYSYHETQNHQVTNYTEKVYSENNGWQSGQRVDCEQVSQHHSVFRYFDANDYSGNGKCLTYHYFDDWGRTVNVVTMNATETEILGVSTIDYTAPNGNSDKNNRITSAASAGVQPVNLLRNSDLEHETDLYGWTMDSQNGNAGSRANSGTTTCIYPYSGGSLMKLYQSNSSSGEFSVKQDVYLEEGETYVFSAWINTACAIEFGTNGGAYLSLYEKDNQTYTQIAKSRVINYKTSLACDNGWERIELTYTVEEGGTYAVAATVNNVKKVAVFDNFMLEKTVDLRRNLNNGTNANASASNYNLLQASNFEYPNASTGAAERDSINQWWSYTTSEACPVFGQAHTGSCSLTFAPTVQYQRRASQMIQINSSSDKTFILSGWGKIAPTNIKTDKEMEGDNTNECRFFGLIAKVEYEEWNNTVLNPDYYYVSFADSISDWQYASGVIVPKQISDDPNDPYIVSTITVYACLDYCVNRAYMDDISLIQEPVQSYDYDDEGNLIMATNSEGKTSTAYDSSDRLTKYTALNGVVYDLSYNGNNRQPETIVSDGITTTYGYDTAGNVTSTRVQAPNNGPYLESGAGYESTKNFQVSATDASGNTSASSYNTAKGLLNSSTNPKGVTTSYSYNANNDRVTSTWQSGDDEVCLFYRYDGKGRIRQLNRKDFLGSTETRQGYHFNYDAWGNTTQIRVGSISTDHADSLDSYLTLASYVYNVNGTLARMNYPGGQYVLYTYDLLDRLIQEVYYDSNDNVKADYRYVYNANGQLAKQYAVDPDDDTVVIESYTFEYDSLGRLIRSREENGGASVQRTEHLYDSANRLTAQNWTIGNKSYSETYSYRSSDGALSSVSMANSDTISFHYDALKRIDCVTTKNASDTTLFTRSYSYLDYTGSSTRTTSQVGTYTVENGSDVLLTGSRYEYDANGNITKIEEAYPSGSTIAYRLAAEYSYDDLNQLETETRYTYDNATGNLATTTEVTYEIDTAGNLSSVETKVNNVVTDTVEYTYGNAYWSDRLTAITVNGTSKNISYATYLNPATWYNGTEYTNLTWTQGRRLESIDKGNDTYSFEYDMSGIRTVKIANGLRHEYITQNGKVVRELVTYASGGGFVRCMDFFYDENGNPLAMRKYRDSTITTYDTFHYVCNAQGDVVQVNYQGGTVYAEYTYDAWGKVLTKSGSLADVNPLRYRGYYYDTETGFYYLQSRYYDPVVKRFLNADSYGSTGQGFLGYNMFAYCENCPTSSADSNGHFSVKSTTIIFDEQETSVCYKTTVTVDSRWKLFWIIPMGKVETYDYYFSVSNTGVVSIDNTQQNVQLLCKRESQHIAMEFVEEVFRVAQAQVPFALEGRTVEGVLLEIYAHYMGYCLNYKPSHTATTDIGSNVVSNQGYDYNAEWFE